MTLAVLAGVVGGVGLFLLGMRLLTDGLRLAAGGALRTILERWTRTPVRGLLSGILITSVVQSSSAVTVAAIGFVNAGLMSLAQAVTVIYGSNLGTTMTGWLVALVGFHVDVKALALPAIGVGMALGIAGRGRRMGAVGEALAGFGVFFLGIDVLRSTFTGLGEGFATERFVSVGVAGALLFVAVGFGLTVLLQSSSAALALILTSAGGGAVPLETAAAMVIGANLGTTSTAALAVIGATSNAKRVAAAHVAFNGITGLVALSMLPVLLQGLSLVRELLNLDAQAAAVLAAFHTLFNLLGVALLLPFTRVLVHFLEERFRTPEEDEARPRYLDKNVVQTPTLATNALVMELARVGSIARRMGQAAMGTPVRLPRIASDRAVLSSLVESVGDFCTRMRRSHLPVELDEALPNALRVSRYYAEVAELAEAIAIARLAEELRAPPELAAEVARFRAATAEFLASAGIDVEGYSPASCADALSGIEKHYQALKSDLLQAGARGQLPVREVVAQLDQLSNVRRLAQQVERGARYLSGLETAMPEGE